MAINNKKTIILIIVVLSLLPNVKALNFTSEMQPYLIMAHQATGSYVDWTHNYNGTRVSVQAVTGFEYDKSGNFNQSYNFSSSGTETSYVNLTNSPMFDTSKNWSISAWVNMTTTSTSTYNTIFSGTKWTGANFPHFDITVNTDADRKVQVQCRIDGSNVIRFNTTSDVTANKWVHIVATYDNSTQNISIWIDNALNVTRTDFNCYNNVSRDEWSIGALGWGRGNQNWAGMIDEILIFNKTLNNTEINYLYNNFNNWSVETIPPAVEFINYSETSGTSLTDRTYVMFNISFNDNVEIRNTTFFVYNSTGTIFRQNHTIVSPTLFNITNLPNGVYFFNATAYDKSGNLNVTEIRNVTINSSTIISFVDYSEAAGSTVTRNYTMFSISANTTGTMINITFYHYNSTKGLVNRYNFSSNNFTINLTNLANGLYYVNATAFDNLNNANTTPLRNVTVLVPINLSFASNSETTGTSINRGYVHFNSSATIGNAFKNITLFWYNSTSSVNQSTNVTSNPAFFNITNLLNGTYFFNATIYDVLNNSNTSTTFNVTIDTIAPFLINNSLSATSVTTGSTISIYADFNDTLSNISSSSVAIVDANNASVSGSPFSMSLLNATSWRYGYVTSPTGTFYVRNYTITDGAGNVNVTTSSLSFIVNAAGSGGGTGGGGGGGGTIECSIDADCQDDYGKDYYCKALKCLLNTTLREKQPCNYNGICEPEAGEDVFNCGDKSEASGGIVNVIKGDCLSPLKNLDCSDPTQPCWFKNTQILMIVTVLAITSVIILNYYRTRSR